MPAGTFNPATNFGVLEMENLTRDRPSGRACTITVFHPGLREDRETEWSDLQRLKWRVARLGKVTMLEDGGLGLRIEVEDENLEAWFAQLREWCHGIRVRESAKSNTAA